MRAACLDNAHSIQIVALAPLVALILPAPTNVQAQPDSGGAITEFATLAACRRPLPTRPLSVVQDFSQHHHPEKLIAQS